MAFELSIQKGKSQILKSILFFIFIAFDVLIAFPVFELNDQYGISFSTNKIKGKPTLMLGCQVTDIEICRKVGRKIYWKLQNILWNKIDKFHFISFVSWKSENYLVEKYLKEAQNRKYESILLDKEGVLIMETKEGFACLHLLDQNSKRIQKNCIQSIDDQEIIRIKSDLISLTSE